MAEQVAQSAPSPGVVAPAQTAASEGFLESVLQILADNIGSYVILEFLVGTDTIVGRQGVLEFVAPDYLVLHDDTCQAHIIGDAHALRFVTICFGEEGENGEAAPQASARLTPQVYQVPQAPGQAQGSQSAQPPAADSAPNAPAPSPPPSGVQLVNAPYRPHSQAAFNYAKRKTRR